MTAAERARAAYALAEAADHPRDKAAFRAAARAWEQIARGGVAFSLAPLQRDLTQLKRDVAAAAGPFQAPSETPVTRPEPARPRVEVPLSEALTGIKF